MKKLTGNLLLLSTVACAAAMLTSASASAGETAFTMSSYSNWPGGKEITAGNYDAVIANLRRASPTNDMTALVASTNLCVAYTVKKALTEADAVCSKALKLAIVADDTSFGSFPTGTATAKALTNRGVLKALSGNSVGAADDFREAAAMRGADEAPSRNLAHLETSPAYRVALLGATAE